MDSEIFGVKSVIDWEILFHVGEENRNIDDVVPTRAGVFEHEANVFEHSATLRFDVVAHNIARSIERDARNFFTAADSRPDAREEQKIADALCVRKRAHGFWRA